MVQLHRRSRRRALRLVGFVAALMLLLSGCDWTMFHGDAGNTGVAYDSGFTAAQATNLVRSWRFHPGYSIQSTPATFQGTVYLAAGNGVLYALDLNTGAVKWSKDYGLRTIAECNSPVGFVSSPAVRKDGNGNPKVYVYTQAGTLQELDGLNGNVVWEARVYDVPADGHNDYYSWSSPILSGRTVYIGVSSDCDNPFIPGQVVAFDQISGALVGRYTTMPAQTDPQRANHGPDFPPTNNYVGAGVWTSPAVDGTSVYVTTASTYDDTNTAHPPRDDNAFDQYSVLKLDAATLTRTGKFAVPQPENVGDPDWGSSPVLFDATIGGQSVPMVGGCNKDGNFYALRRDTMRPVWAVHVGLGQPAGELACLSGAIWDGSRLFVVGNDTTIGGSWVKTTSTSPSGYSWPFYTPSGGAAAVGAIRQLDPATGIPTSGHPYWEHPFRSRVLGACSMNGNKDLIACQTTDWNDVWNALVLLNPSTGTQVTELHDNAEFPGFSTPIWVDGKLLVADTDALRAYTPG
jgi:outer membrane protein assembly factor BamB